jgi:DNA adenine methylase
LKNSYSKSPINYTGGKYKIIDQLLNIFPKKIHNFHDVFCGALNVSLNVSAENYNCYDHNSYIIDLYKYLKRVEKSEIIESINEIVKDYKLDKYNDAGYLNLRKDFNTAPSEIKLFVLSCYSFNNIIRFNNNMKFNAPFGKNKSSYNSTIEQRLITFIDYIKRNNISFITTDFRSIKPRSKSEKDFYYFDPPYLISNASYNDGKRGFGDWSIYEEKDLLHFLDILNSKKIKFALSNFLKHNGKTNDYLISWSKKYKTHYIKSNYKNSSYQTKSKNFETIEVVITNY